MSIYLLIFYSLLAIFGIIYSIFILSYTYGWYRLMDYSPVQSPAITTKASVIIPARNEAANILKLLSDLKEQSIKANSFEVIIVDDHSTDNTASLVKEFISNNPDLIFHFFSLAEEKENTAFKKKAIRKAIERSSGDLIVTTDADCRVGSRWLETIVAFYEKEKPRMIVGPVVFHNETSYFEKMQTQEFLSLIAITGGAIRINKPIMCNGANLAYEKEAFFEAGGFGSDRFSSGDDVFLLLNIRKLFGNKSIRFLKNYDSIVFTEAKKSVKDFFHQRTRWASKNKGYDLNILFVSFSVYMFNLLIVGGLIASPFVPQLFDVILSLILIKILVDVPILIGIGNFVKRSGIFLYAVPLIFLYPVYIVLTGALGILGSYSWKGRQVKN